jgi:hypothetical protein
MEVSRCHDRYGVHLTRREELLGRMEGTVGGIALGERLCSPDRTTDYTDDFAVGILGERLSVEFSEGPRADKGHTHRRW